MSNEIAEGNQFQSINNGMKKCKNLISFFSESRQKHGISGQNVK